MELIIIDAELMPWSALGRGLIDSHFLPIASALETETSFLKSTGFEDMLNDFYNVDFKESNFEELSKKKSKKELAEIFGSAKERSFRAIHEFMPTFESLAEQEEAMLVYKEQMELYGQDGTIHVKPFSILKVVYIDGAEKTFFEDSNIEIFDKVSDDAYCVVDFERNSINFHSNKEDDNRAVLISNDGNLFAQAKVFFDEITMNGKMEGVVIKPEKVYNPGVAPYMKVRNPRYLSIIMGPDYRKLSKLARLISRKSISKKLKISISEFEIGKKMLEIPYHEISETNEKYLALVYKMVCEEKQEK